MDSGQWMASEKVREYRYGGMGLSMKDTGGTIRPMVMEGLYILMGTVTMEIGLMTKLMGGALMSIWMGRSILGIGGRTNNMGMEWRRGLIKLSTREIMSTEKNMGLELSNGQTDQHTLGNFITIIFMVKVYIPGLTVENMRVSGELTRCTVKALLVGRMAENILDNMLKIKKEAMVNSFGLIKDAIEVNGLMVNNTGKELM